MAVVAPRLSADITLVSRLSDARASASNYGALNSPPPQIQTDFLPASLSNSAMVSGESGEASAHSTSNSSIVVDNAIGTLRVTGDGTATSDAVLFDAVGTASAKLIVISFSLTDRIYGYSLTGQLSANDFANNSSGGIATAKLVAGSATLFEVVAGAPPAVALSQTGRLPPGTYTLYVDVNAVVHGSGPFTRLSDSSANFNFALGPTSTPTPTPTATPGGVTQAVNLSTRLLVGAGNSVGIGGFIVTGSAPKQVLLRAIGPSLSGAGVPNALADPTLELRDASGHLIASNDDWCPVSETICLSCCDQIIATGIPPTSNLESAILATLNPGTYTAIIRGKNNSTGVGLLELYDLSRGNSSKLANISTRGFVGTALPDVVIAGFILGGGLSDDVILLRGIGASLTQSGVPNALANPTLDLRNSNGAVVASNDDWQNGPPVSLPPSDPLESAIEVTLPPGTYTAILSGVNNGTGVGLVEVYDLGSP